MKYCFSNEGIAIRVGWAPGLSLFTGKENSDQNKAFNSQNTNYSMIGLCLGLLGIVYVSALMVYMRSKYVEDIKYDERQVTHRWPSESENTQTTTNLTLNISRKSSNDSNFRQSSPENESLDMETDMRSTDLTQTQPSVETNV